MKQILAEDTDKFIESITTVLASLGNGNKKTESETEVTIGDTVAIANIKGYWIGNMIRIDIKFRE